MSLSAEQLAAFLCDGYVAVPGFFTPRETAAMQAEVQRFMAGGLLRNVATAGDGRTPAKQRNLQLCHMYMHSRLFRALPFHPRVQAAVTALIGDPYLLQLDQIFLKPGGDGTGTNWHQDNAYFGISDPTKGTAMWVAIDDATVANGTLHVLPGRFREALPHSRDPFSDHHIRCYPPEERAVAMEVPAGSAVFFLYGVPHCTLGNHTDRDRAAVAFHFVRTDFALPELLTPDRTYHPHLTGPQATGGRTEYGETIAGTWEDEVHRCLPPR
ncbi:MAG: phytanoyl-CoA dioxygenase family protein [Phycisphaerales bacterium]|nr:phytanoyl-CoA dioxygenase family protein [Phycisphaerales bacterium]